MKSIKKLNKTLIFSSFIILLLLITILLFINIENIGYQKNADNTKIILQTTNSIMSDLYYLKSNDMNIILKNEILENIEKLEKNDSELKQKFSIIKEQIKKEELDTEKTIAIFSEYASNMSDSNKEYFNLFFKKINNYLIILIFGIISVIIISVLISRYSSKSYNKIYKEIKKLKNVINFNEEKFEQNSYWEEEKEINNILLKTSKELILNRRLIDLGNFGTLSELLPKVMEQIENYIPVDRLSVAFIDSFDNVIAETAVSKLKEVYLEPGFIESIKKTTLEKITKEKDNYRIINDLEKHFNTINKSQSTFLLLKEGIKSSLTAPIFFDGKCYGFIFFSSKDKNSYNEDHKKFAKKIVYTLKQNIYSHFIVQQMIAATASGFVKIVEGKDNETGNHIVRVSNYSRIIAKEIAKEDKKMTPDKIREIYLFSPLHDMGKVGIPDGILLKPGKLTKEEFEIMKKHVNIGTKILTNMNQKLKSFINYDFLNTAIEITSDHHERYDGSGYPKGKKGKEISMSGRIVAIADVFDALTSKRPYKEAFSIEESLDIIKNETGTHFDPLVFEAFLKNMDEIKNIYEKYKE
ncbi:HD domain-containing protein [Oceanotoga sp. DSM 15011]|uniref:HD domain-containing phosphohydrolase n=1 Tax=Oceanotoga sp. DSM 15011 TaxID=2984951 RepID=UPI0021F42968|nr:HD domain-containing phosphohydrolase [Oceanotoga sp. DSM 15011]UYP00153.1 HD domain-containing protein [Oceanotoga sp. DSM 15011]